MLDTTSMVISGVIEKEMLDSPLVSGLEAVVQNQESIYSYGVDTMTGFSHFLELYFPLLSDFSIKELFLMGIVAFVRIMFVFWTLKDALARSDNIFFQLFSALSVLFLTPVIGLPLYLVLRPVGYKWERGYWREALTAQLVVCPHCKELNQEVNQVCVCCGEALKIICRECHNKYQRHYAYCPECGAPNIDE